MKEHGWSVAATLPTHWVVDCTRVGNGEKALDFLARYRYRRALSKQTSCIVTTSAR
jgi:hypothetical protein